MNILYISGTRRTIDMDGNHLPFEKNIAKQFILSQFGDKVVDAEIYWDRGDYMAEYLSDIVESKNINAVVGYSAGGYIGFYLCNKYKIPGFHINPALTSNAMAPQLQTLDNDMKNAPINYNQLILLGEKDKKSMGGVDFDLSLEFFKKIKFEENGGEILLEPEMEHRITDEKLDEYFKYFRNNYLKK